MEIVVGSPVTGENLYGREGELERLWSRIPNNSILLSSPRRFGKTSLVREMQRAPRDGFEVVYVDVEGIKSPQELIAYLADTLTEPVRRTVFQRLVEGIKQNVDEVEIGYVRLKLRESIEAEWSISGEELFRALQNATKNYIIVIDEIPTFLENLEAGKDGVMSVKMFARWLRHIRQTYDTRFILCGSIGIDNILHRHILSSAVNDLERIIVLPFDQHTATGMMTRIFDIRGIQYEQSHIAHILDKIGTPSPPYFVQSMLQEIDRKTRINKKVTTELIEESYQNVVNKNGREYFDWYYRRLKVVFPKKQLREAVLKTLDHLAIHEPCTRSEIKHVFLNVLGKDDGEEFFESIRALENEFYIAGYDKYSFYVKMFKDWWAEKRIK